MDKESAHALTRVQIAVWLPASCAQCGVEYSSVDDFLTRDVKAGEGWQGKVGDFVDGKCWEAYVKERKIKMITMTAPKERLAILARIRAFAKRHREFTVSDLYEEWNGLHFSGDWRICLDYLINKGELVRVDEIQYAKAQAL